MSFHVDIRFVLFFDCRYAYWYYDPFKALFTTLLPSPSSSCFVCSVAYIISMSPHSVDRWSLIVVGVHFLIAYILIVYTLVAGCLALLERV